MLRHDDNRVFILGGRNGRSDNGIDVDKNWESIIHPAYAMMLSFFSQPIELEDAILKISDFFEMKPDEIRKFLLHIITADECWHTKIGDFTSGFPKKLLVTEFENVGLYNKYSPAQFRFKELDDKDRRMTKAPLSIVWMPNNNCHTSCEYCYADRTNHPIMSDISKITSFIEDAYNSGVVEFLLTGGDFFENQHWRQILDIVKSFGYNIDMISTKKPLTKDEIIDFKKYGIRLQISFDSNCEDTAKKLLHVKDGYVGHMREFIKSVDDLNMDFQIATVLTNINDSIDNLEKIHDFVNSLKGLRLWEIRIAFRSLYSKVDFDSIKCSRYQIKKVSEWIKLKRNVSHTKILWSPDDDDKYNKSVGGSKNFAGPVCSANMTNMVVLPDGDVTICEQLYWNPEFIIGNVYSQSINEIWKSDRAIQLHKWSKNNINKKSPCSICKDFDECFENGNRCFANIIKAYGKEHSDYPDPRCVLAPEFVNNITHQ